jgi:hypothetical protein
MRRRNPSCLEGVGADAEELAERIVNRMARYYGTAAREMELRRREA